MQDSTIKDRRIKLIDPHVNKLMENTDERTARIIYLSSKIAECEYYLKDGRMSNPMKIKWRKRALKDYKKELEELENNPSSLTKIGTL